MDSQDRERKRYSEKVIPMDILGVPKDTCSQREQVEDI